MDLTYPADAEEFRIEIRAWLEEHLPEGWFDEGFRMTPEEKAAWNEEWTTTLFEGGWICATWPEEYGGKGLTTMQGVVLAEEFAKAKAPMRADFFGDTLVGPTILMNGTEEQKKFFLPKILDGSMRWCQGFSEPDSGSDLASLKTTAVQDGDEWVINGQKVWTTQAQFADYCFVLARTDPDVKKQAGISYLLVPMKQPGVEVRGIVQPDGTDEFNEVFFSDARCPIDNVVGGLNNGWKVANDTLGFERGMSATTGYRRFAEEYRLMVEKATENGRIEDPVIRQGLAAYYSKIQIMRINGLRSLTATVSGKRDMGVAVLGAHEQDVLVRDPQGRHGARARHLGCRVAPVDQWPRQRFLARGAARRRSTDLPRQPDDVGVLLLPLGDDLGRHVADPAQHRRGEGARVAPRAQGRAAARLRALRSGSLSAP